MGTELQRAGLAIGECGERWVLDHAGSPAGDPRGVRRRRERRRSSPTRLAPTAGCSAGTASTPRWRPINRAAAAIARHAAGDAVAVLGDIGPCGGFLRPLGEVDAGELETEFSRQARALLEGGADGIVIETMSAIEEVIGRDPCGRARGRRAIRDRVARLRPPAKRRHSHHDGRVAGTGGADGGIEKGDAVGANCGTRMTAPDFAES